MAIDPGGVTGWALFSDGALVAADACADGGIAPWGEAAIIEIPDRVEPGIPLGDVLMCARRAGGYEALCRNAGMRVETVPPVRWKGTLSKALTKNRARAALTAAELERIPPVPKSTAHNMYDAIGLGLWALGRFGRGGGIFR
jgi:hypothetical protein